MVENLLSITRIQDASVPLKKREEMLEEVAGDAVLTTRRRFPDANVQLDLSEDILFLPMEPMLIKQVIVNLLENAVRHSGDTQHIQLHLFRQEEWAVVEVRDHGIGLSPDIMQAVQSGRPLPRDLSGDSTRGMASACPSARASSKPTAASSPPEMTLRAERSSASAFPWRRKHMSEKRLILVVEDERTISNFICRALTANDYKAMSATTGKEALSLFFSHRPDLVLLDLGLPDMDGLDVLKELSGLPQEVPVIIISARDRESEKVKALDMGADD